jgi:hypothetical protein
MAQKLKILHILPKSAKALPMGAGNEKMLNKAGREFARYEQRVKLKNARFVVFCWKSLFLQPYN